MGSFTSFFAENWVTIVAVLFVVQTFIKGLRDALDTTPQTDDNALERFATIATKLIGYIVGFRATKK